MRPQMQGAITFEVDGRFMKFWGRPRTSEEVGAGESH